MTPFPPLTAIVPFGACCHARRAGSEEKSAKNLANVMINSFDVHSLLDTVDSLTDDCHCDSAFVLLKGARLSLFMFICNSPLIFLFCSLLFCLFTFFFRFCLLKSDNLCQFLCFFPMGVYISQVLIISFKLL